MQRNKNGTKSENVLSQQMHEDRALNAKEETERFSKLEMGGARIAVKLQSGVSTSEDRSKVQQGKALGENPS